MDNLIELDSLFNNNYDFATLVSWASNHKIKGIGYYDKKTKQKIREFYENGAKIYNAAYFIEPEVFLPAIIESLEQSKYGKAIIRESGKKYPLGRAYRKMLDLRYELFEKQAFLDRFKNGEE